MPIGTLKLKPGVDVIETPTYNAAQLSASMLIRFYKGLPQKRGGWVQRSETVIAQRVNELHGWADLVGGAFLGIGAGSQLLVNNSAGVITDITPAPPPGTALWSLDNYGQVLLACPSAQQIYKWTPGDPAATALGGSSPTASTSILVVPQVQIVLALGAETGGVFNPLLLRWSDAGDYTDWAPTATNQAGSYVIPQGSYIVGGLASGITVLIWTDVGLTAMSYQGLPFVFGFQPLATGCGLYGRRSKGVIGTRVIWLGGQGKTGQAHPAPGGFFQMVMGASAPQPMECSVWDVLYNNAEFGFPGLFFMAVTEQFNEFELFFPLSTTSAFYALGSIEWGSVKYNFVDDAWDYSFSAQLQRTAWEHVSPAGSPVGADTDGLLQQHEVGYDANGEAMVWSWQTGDFDLAQGEEMVLVDWLIPDFVTSGTPSINLTVGASAAPNAPAVTQTLTVTPSTYWTPNFALRGRQFYLAASGSDLGTFNRLGAVRYRAAPDGRGV
jgi:hypothetical protein